MIRPFYPQTDPHDFLKLKQTFLEIWNHAESRHFMSFTGIPFTEQQVDAWFSDHHRFGIEYYGFVDTQEALLGLGLTRKDLLAGFEIYALAVLPDHRRKGIAKSLCEHMLDQARKDGFSCVDIKVFADNKIMLRLMLDLDFIPISLQHHKRYDGADMVVLRRYFKKSNSP
ncbi:GNAT family N-acetyltransferase [candidate division KSB1 bacterium]|nr:GNAT family N-acetyltransferase [candidate division KSB1 bacterium]